MKSHTHKHTAMRKHKIIMFTTPELRGDEFTKKTHLAIDLCGLGKSHITKIPLSRDRLQRLKTKM